MPNTPSTDPSTQPNLETATLGGGCFWCLEPVFSSLHGVIDASVGYAGGSVPNPSYQLVCTGTSGHAEVVQVIFDPQLISYQDILEVFFSVHDPTTLNRQGGDVGPQYRSVIFYHSPEQKQTAQRALQELDISGVWSSPVVTEIAPLGNYYRAEEYHQEYFEKNPYQGYCQVVIAPKLSKFRKRYQERLKT
jgi:peptide-methionine (S)-S-oxide reductase